MALLNCLFQENDEALALSIRAQPKSSRNRIAGLQGDALKICITAPPVEGKANAALIRFVAEIFNLPKSAVILKCGQQGRTKKLLLHGISLAEARAILAPYLDS